MSVDEMIIGLIRPRIDQPANIKKKKKKLKFTHKIEEEIIDVYDYY